MFFMSLLFRCPVLSLVKHEQCNPNSTRLSKGGNKPKLWTALHQCAFLGASEETIKAFVKLGTFK